LRKGWLPPQRRAHDGTAAQLRYIGMSNPLIAEALSAQAGQQYHRSMLAQCAQSEPNWR